MTTTSTFPSPALRLLLTLAVAIASLVPLLASAGADPTAPPPGLGGAGDGSAHPAAHVASAARAASAVAQLPQRLESVRVGGGQPSTALVDGRMVRIGDRLAEGVVLAIDDQGLSLRGANGAQRWLALAPGIHKTPRVDGVGNDGPARAPLAVAMRHKEIQ